MRAVRVKYRKTYKSWRVAKVVLNHLAGSLSLSIVPTWPPKRSVSYYSRTGRVKGFGRGQERSMNRIRVLCGCVHEYTARPCHQVKAEIWFFFCAFPPDDDGITFYRVLFRSLSLSIFDVHYTNVTAMMMIPKCIHCSLISTSESGENCPKKNWIERLVNNVTVSSTTSSIQ